MNFNDCGWLRGAVIIYFWKLVSRRITQMAGEVPLFSRRIKPVHLVRVYSTDRILCAYMNGFIIFREELNYVSQLEIICFEGKVVENSGGAQKMGYIKITRQRIDQDLGK